VVDKAKGMSVSDVDENTFLDFTSGIGVNVAGHSHPEIIKAITAQAQKFIHIAGTDFYYKIQVDLAKKLSEITPGDFPKMSFLTNSGTESVEAAIKLARYVTRRPRIIAFIGAFHGRSMGALSLTASKATQRRYFSPLLPEVTHVPYAYCYRCTYNLTYPKCQMACVSFIEDVIFKKVAPPEDVASIIVEPIQGEGGYIVPPPDFFPALRRMCDKYKILLIADEVQSGMGRTGKMWAIENWNVIPDIICTAKGLGGGFPIGAIIGRRSLHTWEKGAHGNTFGGNPVACASALAVIKLVQNGLLKNAQKQGKYLFKKLHSLYKKYDFIGDHRGIGLMQGIEIVRSKKSKEKSPEIRDKIVLESFKRGLLLLGCGDNSIRFIPSLIVKKEDIDTAVSIFEDVAKNISKSM